MPAPLRNAPKTIKVTRAVRSPAPPVAYTGYRVYPHGSRHPLDLPEGTDEATARAAAQEASQGGIRHEIRGIPSHLVLAVGGRLKSVPNEGGRAERSLFAYQGGKEVRVA